MILLEQIKNQRRYKQIDLLRMYKQGHISKDFRGYYMQEVQHNFFAESRLVSFYIEEEYEKVEKAIGTIIETSLMLKEALATAANEQDAIKLLKADYEIYQLISYYKGETHLPILSFRQLRAWITYELSFQLELAKLANIKSPLDSIQFIETCLGKNRFKKWKKQYRPYTSTINKLLQALPYRFNSSKKDE